MKLISHYKTMGIFILLLVGFFLPLSGQAQAPGTPTCNRPDDCLRAINRNTFIILEYINSLPNYLQTAAEALANLTSDDTSDATQQLQSSFTQLGNQYVNNTNSINDPSNLVQLTADTFGVAVQDFKEGADPSKSMANKPFHVNELSYATMLGTPPLQNGQGSAKDYLLNASGINLQHVMPDDVWTKNPNTSTADYDLYMNYYKTVMAVQTFNSYTLDNLLIENQNGNQLTPIQTSLVQQVTNSEKWFQTIASQTIGTVLRQILLFESQSYVLLTQLIQTQRQLLTAQIMTNTLLVAVNQDKESFMRARAKGLRPT